MASKVSGDKTESGTPASLLLSIVCAIVVFALSEIQNSFSLDDAFSMRTVLMGYVGLGLTLAFFWKRLEKSPFLKISCAVYLFGLWVSLFVTTLAPVLLHGDSPLIPRTVFQQFGLGFIALSGIFLIFALLSKQKMAPGLIVSSLGALGLLLTSGGSFFVKSATDGSDLITASGHGKKEIIEDAHGNVEEDGEELVAAGHGAHGEGMKLAAKSHGEEAEAEHEEKEEDKGHHEAPPAHHEEAPAEHHGEAPAAHHGADDSEALAPHAKIKKPIPKKPKTASLEHAVEDKEPKGQLEVKAKAVSQGPDNWGYAANDKGPSHWAELADAYRTCAAGHEQSPINIPSSWPLLNDISLDYKLTPLSIVDNGHTIQFNVGDNNYATLAGRRYKLVEFHIHTPSEHTLDGKASPMEIHFVHKDEKDRLALVAVLVEAGKDQKTFGEMWKYVPQALNVAATPRNKLFNIASLLPTKLKSYRYQGSMTTPPCEQNVVWSVVADKLAIGSDQIDAFKTRYKMNARPLQRKTQEHLSH